MNHGNGMDVDDEPRVLSPEEEATNREEKERLKNEKRKIRQEYRKLLTDTEGERYTHFLWPFLLCVLLRVILEWE